MSEIPKLPKEMLQSMEVGRKRHALATIDTAIRMTGLSPVEQIGIATLATVLAYERVVQSMKDAGKTPNRGARHQIIRSIVENFEAKLRGEGQRRDDDPVHETEEQGRPVPHHGSGGGEVPRRADGRVDLEAANAANNPDVYHGGREEDDQDNEEGA